MRDVPYILALAGLLAHLIGVGLALRGRDARWWSRALLALRLSWGVLTVGVLALLLALLTDRFAWHYVAQHSARDLPLTLKATALWGGQEGSLLLWSWLQLSLSLYALTRATPRARPLLPWAALPLGALGLFYVTLSWRLANPFVLLPSTPADGAGLNPILRHPAMVLHPPGIYLGFVALSVPYAFALATLITRRWEAWREVVRPWALLAWIGLSVGLLLGMRWAYDVLGWGGYWGWDPVENAGLLPWLATTALLHAAQRHHAQRRFLAWTLALALLDYALVVFGVFAARSGMIASVHAYAVSPLGYYLLAALALILLPGVVLLLRRRSELRDADGGADPLFSSTGLTSFTLVLFLTLTGTVIVGTLLPVLTDWRIGAAWFDAVTGPQWALLVALLGLCPLVGRGITAQKPWVAAAGALLALSLAWLAGLRTWGALLGLGLSGWAAGLALDDLLAADRSARTGLRRSGALLVHLGFVLMAVGVTGTRLYPFERDVVLPLGQPVAVGDTTLVFEDLQQDLGAQRIRTRAQVAVYRDGKVEATLLPYLDHYADGTYVPTPAIASRVREDLYLVLLSWTTDGQQVTLRVLRNPLVSFLWAGGWLLVAGGLLAFWPWPGKMGACGALALLLLLGFAWLVWGGPQRASAIHPPRPHLNQPAPAFSLTLLDGSPVALSAWRGQVVVLAFWATWCPSCEAEMPTLQTVWDAYRGRGVQVIGVAYQDTRAEVTARLAAQKLRFPVALDEGERLSRLYGVTGVPETFIIDAEGRLRQVFIGPLDEATLRAAIERVLP